MCKTCKLEIKDHGPEPLVANIACLSQRNQNYRTALWTGGCLQLTLMCIPVGGEIGLEMHANLDQLIRIEQGEALVQMGKCKDHLELQKKAGRDCIVIVPAGAWHNICNIGNTPLKLSSIYAPPHHPFGTIHKTKADAENS